MRPDALQAFHYLADEGCKGVKLHPAFDQFDVTCPEAMRLYEAAEQLGMILDFHTGVHWHRLSDYVPIKFDEVAYTFPQLRIVMEHAGGRAFFQETLAVIFNNRPEGSDTPRIFAGATSILNYEAQRQWYLGIEGIKEMIWQIGAESIIYGLDFPYHSVDEIKNDLRLIQESDISDAHKKLILGGNLNRLLSTRSQVAALSSR